MLLAGALVAAPARAERLVFQQGDALYVADADGQAVRRLFAIGGGDTVWAPSPDGRRVAWLAPRAVGAAGVFSPLSEEPVTVWVSDLSGRGRRRLLATSDLRDRQGRRVTQLSAGDDAAGAFAQWGAPDSLAWSADGKSLYLSCASREGRYATFIVDAGTGTAVVDAQERWKSIAPMTQVDARGPLLVGVGAARQRAASPLLVADLAEGTIRSLPPADAAAANKLPPAGARHPALSPDAQTIVFAARGSGLWLVDTEGKDYRRLTQNGDDRSPRWSADGRRVLFLSPGSSRSSKAAAVLSRVEAPSGNRRRVLLTGVEHFFLVPD